jgi:hypothetical protein
VEELARIPSVIERTSSGGSSGECARGSEMGIRFLCPNGHRLNVKSFLAGKRGICPHCNAKFEIPFESVAAAPPPPAAVAASTGTSIRDRYEAREETPRTISAGVPSSAPSDITLASASSSPSKPATAGNPSATPAAQVASFPVQPVNETAAVPPVDPAAAPVLADPIAEAPSAVWYVRTNAGGQFCPARGEMMRQWLDERRVGPDYLVWREGWPEWKRASAVFAKLATTGAILPGGPSGPVAPAPAADDWVEAIIESQSHPATVHRVRPKRPQYNNLLMAISFAVVVLGAILVVVVIIAATRKTGDDNSPPGNTSSSSTSTTFVRPSCPLVASNGSSRAVECTAPLESSL